MRHRWPLALETLLGLRLGVLSLEIGGPTVLLRLTAAEGVSSAIPAAFTAYLANSRRENVDRWLRDKRPQRSLPEMRYNYSWSYLHARPESGLLRRSQAMHHEKRLPLPDDPVGKRFDVYRPSVAPQLPFPVAAYGKLSQRCLTDRSAPLMRLGIHTMC